MVVTLIGRFCIIAIKFCYIIFIPGTCWMMPAVFNLFSQCQRIRDVT
ncbi:MAG: hypothetical protein KBD78_01915 [Oligoflexales bacterium]|nr:hypothetical protein [Oligoflexales bacterium]